MTRAHDEFFAPSTTRHDLLTAYVVENIEELFGAVARKVYEPIRRKKYEEWQKKATDGWWGKAREIWYRVVFDLRKERGLVSQDYDCWRRREVIEDKICEPNQWDWRGDKTEFDQQWADYKAKEKELLEQYRRDFNCQWHKSAIAQTSYEKWCEEQPDITLRTALEVECRANVQVNGRSAKAYVPSGWADIIISASHSDQVFLKIIVEVKPELTSVSSTIRQINVYDSCTEGPTRCFVVTFQERTNGNRPLFGLFEAAGIKVLTISEADMTSSQEALEP